MGFRRGQYAHPPRPFTVALTARPPGDEIDQVMLAVLALLPLALTPQEGADGPIRSTKVDPQWTYALDWLRTESERFAVDLGTAKASLLARAEVEDPAVAESLRDTPEPIAERGYRVLPRLQDDPGLAAVTPHKMVYSLENISTAYAWAIRDASVLARIAVERPEEPLAPLVGRYERLRKKRQNLEEHIAYHAYWQDQVTLEAEFFAERNEILALVEEWHLIRENGADPTRREVVRREWSERLAPFGATEGLTLERHADGALVLPVTVTTDIEDELFLARFEKAVEVAFSESAAALERRFRIALSIVRVQADELYPEGAPARASEIVEENHRARFPANALVLTTGAKSTHSYVGRTIQLGADPMPPRTLAHEFGHLLGFRDAYLRASTGDPTSAFGAQLVEWTGLLDDLMGDARRGRVTPEMIDRLIAAYGG